MLLTRLKYWRELRGYTLKALAEKSKVGFTTISFLENRHRPPHGTTASKLASALGVEVADLYGPEPPAAPAPVISQPLNDKETIKSVKPARARTAKKQPASAGNCWVIDHESDAFGPFVAEEAERLKGKLGGQHQARVYEAASKNEARELHRAFLIRVARGHDAW